MSWIIQLNDNISVSPLFMGGHKRKKVCIGYIDADGNHVSCKNRIRRKTNNVSGRCQSCNAKHNGINYSGGKK
jgi:hypothetical protein